MQFHFITIPISDPAVAEQELNRFLSSHRVVAVDRQLVVDGPRTAWALAVEYLDGAQGLGKGPRPGGKIDYREVLSAADSAFFLPPSGAHR